MKLIELENCKAGYILKGFINHKSLGHYIIFIEPYRFHDFIGAMISTKNFQNKNVLMLEQHFNKTFEDGTDCAVTFNESYLVLAKLHKYFEMGPFELCGKLSDSGLKFTIDNLNNLNLLSWDEYLQDTNNINKSIIINKKPNG